MYSYELLGHNGDTSIVSMFKSSKQYWSSGKWGGQYFSNIPESYIRYAIEDPTVLSRGIMDVSGQMKVPLWFEGSSQDWQTVYTVPKSQCDAYATCGPFTVCNDVPSPSYSCMKGYSIRSPQDWEVGDRSARCARNTPLYCNSNSSGAGGETDKFYPMASVQLLPDAQNIGTATAKDECSLACLGNCSCTVYSYDQGACSIWHGKMLNVREQGNSVLHLRLAAKEVQSTLPLWVLIFLMMVWMRKKQEYGDGAQGGMGIIAFRYVDLQHATKVFREVGAGSFGSVFEGSLSNSTAIAVKRRWTPSEKKFRAEVSSTGFIQHVNLVKLIGFCCQGDGRLLVYEYMPNGSLDSHLFQSNGMVLDWTTRYKIALGVASGLAYLHLSCQDCIIHCDIKPENIPLDGSSTPKVVVTTTRGTIGYLAREWISGTAITSKVDVYSYGMVMLEIVSGSRKSSKQASSQNGVHEGYFPVRVARRLVDGDVASLVDAKLLDEVNLEEVERVCKVACWCIQDDELDRPTMTEVVRFLECLSEVETPPVPRLLQAIAGQPNLKIM
ncbi:hypothetical protein ZWY2020_044441 [Hordeum vulgare]|nr:hypothetical protein ZWY2020_044441 [Hordeum vulgare]